jgi:hypothetical protein
MTRFSACGMLLRVLGLLLLTAAVLKGHELLTVPMANKDLWSWRPFLIFQVECELALAIWLLSGLFKRLAWLAALTCFSVFCCVTLYKGITGAASCGCFGTVHVNPWVTLLAIDLPGVLALGLFRPRSALSPFLSFLRRQESTRILIRRALGPLPPLPRFAATTALGAAMLGLTTPILALNEPPVVTSTYEVLEPETWIGKPLPILNHIDIGEQLNAGAWLIVLYHYDCPACLEALPRIEQMVRDLKGNEEFLQVALIEVPPYGRGPISEDLPCVLGRMDVSKEWFVITPAVVLTSRCVVRAAWEGETPGLETVIQTMQ